MNDIQEVEFIMISETNFEKLELLEKDETEVKEQVYEEVAGFESLDSKLQTRTTAFSCKKESEDYNENYLMSRPLPWVVRVFFKIENSMKGILCSGKHFFISPICFGTAPFKSFIFQQLLLIISGW